MTMSAEEIEVLANSLRSSADEGSCCPVHAAEALMLVIISFALNSNEGDCEKAAEAIEAMCDHYALRLRLGHFMVAYRHDS